MTGINSQYNDIGAQRNLLPRFREMVEQYKAIVPFTTRYIWGKEVRITYVDILGKAQEYCACLEDWVVKHIITPEPLEEQIPQIVRKCRRCEVAKVEQSGSKDPLICQLTDWRPLEDYDKGVIIRKDPKTLEEYIIMVKYAHVVDQAQFKEVLY